MQINFYFELHFTGWQNIISVSSRSPYFPRVVSTKDLLKCQGKRGVCHLAAGAAYILDRVFCFFKISSLSVLLYWTRNSVRLCMEPFVQTPLTVIPLLPLGVVPKNKSKSECTGSLSRAHQHFCPNQIRYALDLEESLSSPVRKKKVTFFPSPIPCPSKRP